MMENNEITPSNDVATFQPQNEGQLDFLKSIADQARAEIQKVIIGQDVLIDQVLICLFSGGHVLLEGVPGVAKTLTVKLLSKVLNVDFKRIQFTPDLMPTDVTGTSIYNMKEGNFEFKKGPIFSNLILIDEINRAPAKTQSALFEVMEEHQVTIDGVHYPMGFPLFIVATQNPVEQEGTYKLPEAQLDRFLFKIKITYPSVEQEYEILARFQGDFEQKKEKDVQAVASAEDVAKCCAIVEKVTIKSELLRYIAALVDATRNSEDLYLGASPRASLAIMKTAKATAALRGRNFVTPDDIKVVAPAVLNHRVILSPDKEMEGVEVEEVVLELLQSIEVPR